LALERAANALRYTLEERLQLRLTPRRDAPEHRWLGTHEVRTGRS
jgi:hypothetical protein